MLQYVVCTALLCATSPNLDTLTAELSRAGKTPSPQLVRRIARFCRAASARERGQLLKLLVQSKTSLKPILKVTSFERAVAVKQKLVLQNLSEKLRGASFQQAYSSKGYQQGQAVFGAQLIGLRAPKARLDGADLHRANISRADLKGAQLMTANLSRAVLNEANLRRANLSRANLSRASLFRADARQADLRRANLRHARMRMMDLRNAFVMGADLRGADLQGAMVGKQRWLETCGARIDPAKWAVSKGRVVRRSQ